MEPGGSWHERSVAFRDEYRRSFGDFGTIRSHHGLAVLAFPGNHRTGHSGRAGGSRHQCPTRTVDRDRHDGYAGRQAKLLSLGPPMRVPFGFHPVSSRSKISPSTLSRRPPRRHRQSHKRLAQNLQLSQCLTPPKWQRVYVTQNDVLLPISWPSRGG
jgi:hypothetical protein